MMRFCNAYLGDDGDLHLEKTTGEGSGFRVHVSSSYVVRLYSWPMYGGDERDEGEFTSIAAALQKTKVWT